MQYNSGNGFWEATILGQDFGTTVGFYVTAENEVGGMYYDPPMSQTRPDSACIRYYTRQKGDLNGNACIEDQDLLILEQHLCPPFNPLTPEQAFFADMVTPWNVINWDDYEALDDIVIPFYSCAAKAISFDDQFVEASVEGGSAGSMGNLVSIYMENDSLPVGDFAVRVEYDPNVLEVEGVDPIGRAVDYVDCEPPEGGGPGHLRKMYNTQGSFISTGSDSVVELSFAVRQGVPPGSSHITITGMAAKDTLNNDLDFTTHRGKFFVPAPPPLSVVSTPLTDTTLCRLDTLAINTTVTNHSWQGITASIFLYGEVEVLGNEYLVIDTTSVFIPVGARMSAVTELQIPSYAPISSYSFTTYVFNMQNQTTYDTDSFDFSVIGCSGMSLGENPDHFEVPWYRGDTLEGWEVISGGFEEFIERGR